MTLTFMMLEKPITIDYPIEATFTEYRVYRDIKIHFAKATLDSIYKSLFSLNDFVLREVLQNAIDAEILKTGALEKINSGNLNERELKEELNKVLWAYKKVKLSTLKMEYMSWGVIESEGTLPEDIFLLGYSSKEDETKLKCSLIGRYGVGLKESIFALLYSGQHMFMIFGGHIYGFGYYYKEKVYYDLDLKIVQNPQEEVFPVILRGQYNVKDKIIVYVPTGLGSKVPLLYPHEKPYAITERVNGRVYQNGLYSGEWTIPIDINVCNIKAEQYRLTVPVDRIITSSLNMIADNEMYNVFKQALHRNIFVSGKVWNIRISFAFESLFEYANEEPYANLRNVLQKALNLTVEEVAEKMNEKVIIVDRERKIKTNGLPGIGLPDIPEKYVKDVRSYLADKGYKVFEYSANLNQELLSLYNSIAEPNIPVKVKALIKLAEWLYSVAVAVMKQYRIPGWSERFDKAGIHNLEILDPIPGIFDIDVKVVKPQYNDLLTDSLGLTLKLNNKNTIILRNLPEEQWLLYVGTTLHELNHVYSEFEHGTFEWESIYDTLYMIDVISPGTAPYVTNLIRLAVYNPELFLKVNNINGLPPYVLPQILVVNGECIGYMDERGIECDASASTKLKLVNRNGILYLEVEPK